jgi:hypothetical protein
MVSLYLSLPQPELPHGFWCSHHNLLLEIPEYYGEQRT